MLESLNIVVFGPVHDRQNLCVEHFCCTLEPAIPTLVHILFRFHDSNSFVYNHLDRFHTECSEEDDDCRLVGLGETRNQRYLSHVHSTPPLHQT